MLPTKQSEKNAQLDETSSTLRHHPIWLGVCILTLLALVWFSVTFQKTQASQVISVVLAIVGGLTASFIPGTIRGRFRGWDATSGFAMVGLILLFFYFVKPVEDQKTQIVPEKDPGKEPIIIEQPSLPARPIAWKWSPIDPALGHLTGNKEGESWVVSAPNDKEQFLTYGPYKIFRASGSGEYVVYWDLEIDSNSGDDIPILKLDIHDFDAPEGKTVIEQKIVTRKAWEYPSKSQRFSLPFRIQEKDIGHRYEFRVFWLGVGQIKLKQVGVTKQLPERST